MCLVSAVALLLAAHPIDIATAHFDDITRAVSENGRQRSREIMEQWVAAHPTDPDAGRGLVWIAQLWMADGFPAQARPFYARAARDYPGTEWGNHGIRGMAELDVESRHYWRAVAGYQVLADNPAPFWNYVGRTGLQHARSERLRFFFFLAAVALLLGLCGFRVWAARRAGDRLRRIPEECLYVLPVFLLMIVAAFHQPVDEGHTVITMAVGGMAVLWANGVYLRSRPPRSGRRLLETLLGLAQAAAVLYCAVVLNGVWSKFYETLVMGAE